MDIGFQISLRAKLFTTNMVWGVNMQPLYTIAKPLWILLLTSLEQHHNTDMLPTMWAQKLNKLDDSKNFKF